MPNKIPFDLQVEKYSLDELKTIVGIHAAIRIEDLQQVMASNFEAQVLQYQLNPAETVLLKLFYDQAYSTIQNDTQRKIAIQTQYALQEQLKQQDPIIRRMNLAINTKDRVSAPGATSTCCTIELTDVIYNVSAISLVSLDLPRPPYLIHDVLGNNKIVLTFPARNNLIVEFSVGPIPNVVTSVSQLISALNVTVSTVNTQVSTTIAVDYVTANNRFVMRNLSTTEDVIISFTPTTIPITTRTTVAPHMTLGWLLGFRELTSYSLPPETFVTADTAPNIIASSYYDLEIIDFRNSGMPLFLEPHSKTLLARLSRYTLDPISQSMLQFNDHTDTSLKRREYTVPIMLSRIDIRLYDEAGRFVYLNGLDFTFILQVEYLYSPPRLPEM
jgi:hypothetical protein